jgi:predicted nucleic acid-binding protein
MVETAYLLRRSGVSLDPLLVLIEVGHVELLPLGRVDVPGINRVRQTYRDQELDLADLCLMHLAEREDIQHVFTVDRRHFGVFRKRDGSALDLHP